MPREARRLSKSGIYHTLLKELKETYSLSIRQIERLTSISSPVPVTYLLYLCYYGIIRILDKWLYFSLTCSFKNKKKYEINQYEIEQRKETIHITISARKRPSL